MRKPIVVVACLVLVSCSTPVTSTTAPGTPSPAAGATDPGAAPSEAPSDGSAVRDLSPSSAALEPGTYSRLEFAPRVLFDVEGPWYAVQAAEGFFDIQQDRGSPDVIAVQFANVEAVYGANGQAVALGTAEAGLPALEAHPGLTILGSSAGRMDGHEGIVVEVENATDGNVPVLLVPAGPLQIAPERRLWIALFDTSAGVLGVLVGGSVARWDEALLTAEPVLETVRIED